MILDWKVFQTSSSFKLFGRRPLCFQLLNEMLYAIWYHFHNLKNVKKNNHGRVILLVKLQAETLLKVLLLQGCFSPFKLYKWYQIVQSMTNNRSCWSSQDWSGTCTWSNHRKCHYLIEKHSIVMERFERSVDGLLC